MKHRAFAWFAVAGFFLLHGHVHADEKVYQRAVRSAVMISSGAIRASGVLVDKEQRLVITAQHVTAGRTHVEVAFAAFDSNGAAITDSRYYLDRQSQLEVRGRVLHSDASRDLAVIQLDRLPPGVEAIALAKASARPGQDIHCIGNAAFRHGGAFGYSYGKVRNVFRRQISGPLNNRLIVETQIPTNKGDSGGPIVNGHGELIAIVSQGTTGVSPPQNDPFHAVQVVDHSVDVSEVRFVLANLGKPATAVLKSNGTLRDSDPLRGNRYTKIHPLQLEAGTVYVIHLRSRQFDAFLRVEDSAGKQLAEDDDGGEGTDARLEFVPQQTGDYRVIVTTYRPLATGSYSLEVEQR